MRTIALLGGTLAAAAVCGWWLTPEYGLRGILYLVVGIGAVAGVAIVFLFPITGVLLLAFMIPLEGLVVFGDPNQGVTLVRVLGLLVFAAWGLRHMVSHQSWSPILSVGILRPALLFLLVASASLLWVADSSVAIRELFTTVQLVALTLLIIDVVDSRKRQEWLVRVLVLSGTVVLMMTLTGFGLPEGYRRAGSGVAGGVNQTANYIVFLVPLAFYLLRTSSGRVWRGLGLIYIVLSPIAITQTFSRISFVIMPIVIASQVWDMARRNVRNFAYVLIVGLLASVIVVVTVDWQPVLDRVETIAPSIEGEPGPRGQIQSSRMHHWLGAIAIFNDFPILGVGYANYGVYFRDTYQFVVADKWVIRYFDSPRSPHSSFLGILAELGVVGGLLWVSLIGAALVAARRSWSASARANDESQMVLSQAIFFSIVSILLYSIVAEIHLDKLVWVLLGLAAVLPRLAPVANARSDSPGTVALPKTSQ